MKCQFPYCVCGTDINTCYFLGDDDDPPEPPPPPPTRDEPPPPLVDPPEPWEPQ